MGSMPGVLRAASRGCQAAGTAEGGPDIASTASKYRLANTTSRCETNAWSPKNPCLTSLFTPNVTSRYIRLKQATPSLAGSAAWIAPMRAMTSSMVAAGGAGAGKAEPMARGYVGTRPDDTSRHSKVGVLVVRFHESP